MREKAEVRAVEDATLERILPFVSEVVAEVIQFIAPDRMQARRV